MLAQLSQAIADSALREGVLYLLMNVPGLPPILQTVHLACIALVAGSAGFVYLRALGWAVPSQSPAEMTARLMPWLWCALGGAFVSGIVFVIARPDRYFFNPIAGYKVLLLGGAAAVALLFQQLGRHLPGFWSGGRWLSRALAGFGLLLWIGVIFAGRWIAYVDYLFWE